jgi:quercetin dioxygenase-like cupin family protein
MTTAERGWLLRPGEGAEVFTPEGHPTIVKAGTEATHGAYSLVESTHQSGSGPPPHVHLDQDEAWYVVRGELTFRVGDQELVAPAGAFVFAPRGVPHAFTVTSADPATFLLLFSPPVDGLWAAFSAAQRTRPEGQRSLRALDPGWVEATRREHGLRTHPVTTPFPWGQSGSPA